MPQQHFGEPQVAVLHRRVQNSRAVPDLQVFLRVVRRPVRSALIARRYLHLELPRRHHKVDRGAALDQRLPDLREAALRGKVQRYCVTNQELRVVRTTRRSKEDAHRRTLVRVGRRVKGCAAGNLRSLNVSAARAEQLDYGCAPHFRRPVQRRRFCVAVRGVDSSAARREFDEGARHVDVPHRSSHHQGRRTVLRLCVDVRAALEQRMRDSSVPHCRCRVQRRLPVLNFLLVNVRAIV